MERVFRIILLICAALAVVGCGEEGTDGGGAGAGTGGAAGSGGSAGRAGAGGEGGMLGTAALEPLDEAPRFAVVSTDFSSSSIAMLDEDFVVIDESWLSSGTTYPGLVASLSGDVVLPNRQAGDGTFTVIDRFFTDVVTRFFLPSGNLNGQVRTHGAASDSGFSSNPQDFIFVDADSAWVPRYEVNLNPVASPENRGNDLIEINPSDMSATGARIDLSPFDTSVTIPSGDASTEVDVFARPSRGILFGTTMVLGLDRISAGFDAAGSGMVAVIDLEDHSVVGLELSGLASCGNAVPVPEAPSKVLVACVGFAQPFGDEPQVRASSGLVLLDIGVAGVEIERIWRVADDPSAAISVNSVIAIDDRRALGVATGNFVDTVDQLYLIDLVTGDQELVLESGGSFVTGIGLSAYDPDSRMLYVPDAFRNVVVELAADDDGFVEVGSTEIAPGLSLPPSKVYLLD
jgi:hypothetical protein